MFARRSTHARTARALVATSSRVATALGAGLARDVAAALFPASCRACGRTLPREARAGSPPPKTPRRIASLVDGSLARPLPGAIRLPSWFACRACAASLLARPEQSQLPDGVACITAFLPQPLLFALVHAFKYEAQRALCDWFAARLAVAARARLGRDFVLLPVPSHPGRIRERGFDATASLAEAVARRAGVAVVTGSVLRARATAPQARLAHAARAANVAGAFARTGRLPPLARIVVLDDVVTTGATVGEVCATLGRSADRLAVLALCRARDPGMQDAARL